MATETIVTRYELDVKQFEQRLTDLESKLGIVRTTGESAAKGIGSKFNAVSAEIKASIKSIEDEIKRLQTLSNGKTGTALNEYNKKINEAKFNLSQLNKELQQQAALNIQAGATGVASSEANVVAKTAENVAVKGLTRAYSLLRTAANIIPGLGISGVILAIGTGLAIAAESAGLFTAQSELSLKAQEKINDELRKRREINDELIKSNQDLYLAEIQNNIDILDSIKKLNEAKGIKTKEVDVAIYQSSKQLLEQQLKDNQLALDTRNKALEFGKNKLKEFSDEENKIRQDNNRLVARANQLEEETGKKQFIAFDNTRKDQLALQKKYVEESLFVEETEAKKLFKTKEEILAKLVILENKTQTERINAEKDASKKVLTSTDEFYRRIIEPQEKYLEKLRQNETQYGKTELEILSINYEKERKVIEKWYVDDYESERKQQEALLLLFDEYQKKQGEIIGKGSEERIKKNQENENRLIVQGVEKKVELARNGGFAELQAKLELSKLNETLDKQKASSTGALSAEITDIERKGLKERSDLQQVFMVAQINRVQEAGKTIFSAIEAQQNQNEKINQIKLDKEEKQQSIEREKAEKGLKNNLAFEDKRVAELEKKQLEQAKKERNVKLGQILINSILEYTKRDPDTAVPKGLVTAALALAATAAFGEEGGLLGDNKMPTSKIGTINNPFFSRTHTGGGDILLHAQEGEGLLSRKNVETLGGKKGFYDLKKSLDYGTYNKDIAKLKYVSNNTVVDIAPLQQEMKELKNIVKGQKQFDPIQFVEQQNKFILTTIENNVKKQTELVYRKNRIG